MTMDSKWRSSENIKDLMVSEKPSHGLLVTGIVLLAAALGAAGYWYTLPPKERPSLAQLTHKAMGSFQDSSINPSPPPSHGFHKQKEIQIRRLRRRPRPSVQLDQRIVKDSNLP